MGAKAREIREQQSSPFSRVAWTTVPANYDVGANHPNNKACRGITVGTSGTLVYTGLDGVDVTLPAMGVPWRWDIQASVLKNTSTAQNVVVHW